MKGNENEQDHIADFNLVETLKQREEKQQRQLFPTIRFSKDVESPMYFFLTCNCT